MRVRTVWTYTLELLDLILDHRGLSGLLGVSEMTTMPIWGRPQAKRVQELIETVQKSSRIGLSAHFGELFTMSLKLRDFSLFHCLESGYVCFFPQSPLQLLVASGRNAEDRQGLCDLVIIASVNIWVEIRGILLFGKLLIQLLDTSGKILPNRTAGIVISTRNGYCSHLGFDFCVRLVNIGDLRSNFFDLNFEILLVATAFFLRGLQF